MGNNNTTVKPQFDTRELLEIKFVVDYKSDSCDDFDKEITHYQINLNDRCLTKKTQKSDGADRFLQRLNFKSGFTLFTLDTDFLNRFDSEWDYTQVQLTPKEPTKINDESELNRREIKSMH